MDEHYKKAVQIAAKINKVLKEVNNILKETDYLTTDEIEHLNVIENRLKMLKKKLPQIKE